MFSERRTTAKSGIQPLIVGANHQKSENRVTISIGNSAISSFRWQVACSCKEFFFIFRHNQGSRLVSLNDLCTSERKKCDQNYQLHCLYFKLFSNFKSKSVFNVLFIKAALQSHKTFHDKSFVKISVIANQPHADTKFITFLEINWTFLLSKTIGRVLMLWIVIEAVIPINRD